MRRGLRGFWGEWSLAVIIALGEMTEPALERLGDVFQRLAAKLSDGCLWG